MSIVTKVIPFVELLLVIAMLGLGLLGYLSLQAKSGKSRYRPAQKWILPSFILLALLSILLLFIISFMQG